MNDKDLEQFGLQIVCDNAYDLAQHSKEEFILLRRNSFGASDSSVLLGVNPFMNTDDLINQKCSVGISKEELAVGDKENVRKGADLEPLILQKFEQWSGFDTYKPDSMYKIELFPWLTVNFDGIICLDKTYIPVEAKFVSAYANKYWERSKAISKPHEGFPIRCAGRNIKEHVEETAATYGIPPYYYTQVQQQLLALQAPFGYLIALFDKGWEIGVYKIFADTVTQNAITDIGKDVWSTVEARKNETQTDI